MLPCHSGQRHKQDKSRGNTSSCVGGQVKTRSLSLICQQNKQRTDKLKFCYKCFDWTLSGDRKEEREEMLSGRERYIFPQSNTFFFFLSCQRHTQSCGRSARRPVSSRTDWQGCGVECRALSGLSCVIIASHAVSLTDVLRRGRPVTQKQSRGVKAIL